MGRRSGYISDSPAGVESMQGRGSSPGRGGQKVRQVERGDEHSRQR